LGAWGWVGWVDAVDALVPWSCSGRSLQKILESSLEDGRLETGR
jgi:hypothetical protein